MTDIENRWTRIDSTVIKALKLNTYEGEVILIETVFVGSSIESVLSSMSYTNLYFNSQEFFSERELEAMAKATMIDNIISFVQ